MTCFVNKTVRSCGEHDCISTCRPESGLAIWFCRQNHTAPTDMECLENQMIPGPNVIEFNKTSDYSDDDKSTNFTLAYTIRSGEQSDSDVYYCVGGTPDQCFGGSYPRGFVNVTFKEGLPPQNVSIRNSQTNKTENTVKVKEGNPLSLSCNAEGYPTPNNYTWYKDNGKNKHRINDWIGHFQRFHSINKTDDGYYECKVSNSQGSSYSVIQIKVDPSDSYWRWWMAIVISVAAVVLVVTLIYAIWRWRHPKKESPRLMSHPSDSSGDEPDGGAKVFNVQGEGNRIFVGQTINFYTNQNEYQPLDNNSTITSSCERWLVYYHPSDKALAEMTKRRLEDKFSGNIHAVVKLWDEVRGGILKAIAHGGSTKLLSKFLCDYNFSIIIRTDRFAENEVKLVNALSKISDQDQKNQILSNMFILNGTEQSLHECLENQGPTVKNFSSDSVSSDNSFWEDFLHCAVSVNRTFTAPTITVAEDTTNPTGDEQTS
ncbi:uncharacterized protein [Amphiura filiformis]|uniref:uncharacterized protein n=1 Tax=Amphiura filiformis TaxID=82378 RepID=UPI003B20D09A